MAASSSMPESVCEELEFSSESNHILLKALMEETQEEHDQYYAADRLMSMIQSLEAELSYSSSSYDPCQSCDMEVGQVDDQDCSTSSSLSFSADWDYMEIVSASSSFDEEMMMNAWSLCDAGGDDSTADYHDSSEFYYGVLLENYLPQEATGVVF
ncbi:hypothetical protein QN277_008933 [Acacia crassicarpa]|uniref:Uncharacterized protein n=1 Tax=Acacia crassicarpa TaxID=499986 RepID=A0AAE1M766_9FABA|nr:hypothetical protein QN277_008933 [Acacia crassicarpa]